MFWKVCNLFIWFWLLWFWLQWEAFVSANEKLAFCCMYRIWLWRSEVHTFHQALQISASLGHVYEPNHPGPQCWQQDCLSSHSPSPPLVKVSSEALIAELLFFNILFYVCRGLQASSIALRVRLFVCTASYCVGHPVSAWKLTLALLVPLCCKPLVLIRRCWLSDTARWPEARTLDCVTNCYLQIRGSSVQAEVDVK